MSLTLFTDPTFLLIQQLHNEKDTHLNLSKNIFTEIKKLKQRGNKNPYTQEINRKVVRSSPTVDIFFILYFSLSTRFLRASRRSIDSKQMKPKNQLWDFSEVIGADRMII